MEDTLENLRKARREGEGCRDRLVRAGGDEELRGCFPGKCQTRGRSESSLRAPSRPPRPRPSLRPHGEGAWSRARPLHRGRRSPRHSPARCQAPVSLPLPRAELPRDTVRPLSECALGAEVPPTCVRPVPPGRSRRGAPHKGDRVSGGRPAPGTGAPPAQPQRLRRGGRARGPLRLPPAAPARAPASGRRVRHCPPVAVPQAGPDPRPLQRGLLSPRQPKRHPGRARSGRYPDRQSDDGDVPPPPPPPPLAGLQSPASRPARQRRVTCAPRPSPRRSRAPLPRAAAAAAAAAAGAPPPSASQWRRPDWRDARRALIQSQGPPGSKAQSQPHAEAPAGLGRAGLAARARRRAGAEGRRRRWKRCAGSLFFRGTHGAFQEGGGPAREDEGPLDPESRAAGGRRTGRGGGNRPEGGTARSRLLAGTAASEFPGRRGGAGRSRKPSLNQFKTRGW
ncbi:PREDICTED: basic proline-rich protein-like [Lipotes vexillifer]|uniref:Basic proline-rich protein-like n=1 Tax=Lipotes vexillifer TaxID=118797 RepID=A0A340YDB1_LIPVE|nr:PREDICTED: basic proline-rich protein-like [Lipotes vexillifer]